MGFQIPGTVVMEFDGPFASTPDKEGLKLRCRLGLPIREQFEIRRIIETIPDDSEYEVFEKVFREWFARVKPEWNVTDDNDLPIPITADAVLALLPGELVVQIMPKWREAMGVSGPLVGPSSSGATAPDSLIQSLADQSKSPSS